MKLFLTSTGLENKKISNYFENNLFSKEIKDLSFLVVSIQDSEQDTFYLEKTLSEIKNTGASNIDIFKLANEKFTTKKEYDVIFVCGGNTFDYLDRIRKAELDKVIIDFAKKDDNVYVGVSAGSIIAGPSIEISGWGSEGDKNNIGLTDLQGLELTNFAIYPHYREDLELELEEFKKRVTYPIIELQDDQAVLLNYFKIGKLNNTLAVNYINKD